MRYYFVCMNKTHPEFARWLKEQMAAAGLNNSALARQVWGTTKDSRGYNVAQNRDRIGWYLKGLSYPNLDTRWKLGEVFGVFPDDIPGQPARGPVWRATPAREDPFVQINRKLDAILSLVERAE